MYKVMIVDDMDVVRLEVKRLKLWGEKSGFIISEEARNGHEALLKLEKSSVDMVITDIKMPKIDGIELLRDIVKRNLCSCVVLLSDFSEFEYARQGIILGAFDYVAKPVVEEDFECLLQRAGEFITNKRSEIERIRRLEASFEEKNDVLISKSEISELIKLIQSREESALHAAIRIIDRVGLAINYDPCRADHVFKNGISEAIKSLLENNCWLEKFIVNEDFIDNFFKCKDFKCMKIFLIKKVRLLINIYDKLLYGYQDKGIVWRICNYVLENIDSELSLKIVADKLYMNKTYISEAFKQKTGISFINYLTMVKIERSKILMQTENLKLYEIAEKLGYKDVEYFGKIFKKYIGITPTEFRQNTRKN